MLSDFTTVAMFHPPHHLLLLSCPLFFWMWCNMQEVFQEWTMYY